MMKTDIGTILYISQVVSLMIVIICTLVMIVRMKKAVTYMDNYIREHQNKNGIVSREFKKVMKMLGGK